MPDRPHQHLTLLDHIPVSDIAHIGRPLREHLIGTHGLLHEWGSPDPICLAGLFHSVYGTKTFTTAALSTASRNSVRALIGERAEKLVFIFGTSDRKKLLLENSVAPYVWTNHQTGDRTEISDTVLGDLVEIEVANFLDQLPFLPDGSDLIIRDMWQRFESATSHMSSGARQAFRRAADGRTESVPPPANESSR